MKLRRHDHVLATILYTDIVASTRLASDLGDRRWRAVLAHHHLIVRKELKRHQGRELDNAGDGFLAAFDDQERAILCACAIVEAVRVLGIEVRAGLHVGQAEVVGRKLSGIVVNAGARVMAEAGPGQVLVSGVLKDLVPGSGFAFADVGGRELKGINERWNLFVVTSVEGKPLPQPLEAEEAASRLGAIKPPPIVQRRWGQVSIAVLGLAVISGVAVFVAMRAPSILIRPNSLLRVDSETNEVIADIPVGELGGEISASPVEGPDHQIFVLSSFDQTISVIDERSGSSELIGGLGTRSRIGFGIAYLAGSVWVTGGNDTVLELSPGSHPGVLDEIRLQGDLTLMTAAYGRIWVLSPGSIRSIDPSHHNEVSTLRRGIYAGDFNTKKITGGAGFIWLSENTLGIVYRVDPETGRSIRIEVEGPGSQGVTGGPSGITVAFGYVWVSDPRNGFVHRIDPETNHIEPWARFAPRSGYEVSGIAAANGSIWVASPKTKSLVRIDPFSRTAKPEAVELPFAPQDVIAADGDVWVTIARFAA